MQKSYIRVNNKTRYFIEQKSVVKVQGNPVVIQGSGKEPCGKSPSQWLYDIPRGETPKAQKVDQRTLGCEMPNGLGVRKLNYITQTQYQGGKQRLLESSQPILTTCFYLHIIFYGK